MGARVTEEKENNLEKGRGLGPLGWLLGQALADKVHEVRRPARGGEGRRGLRGDALHDAHDGVGLVGVLTLGQLDGGDAQRPNVGLQTCVLVEHLGSHVGRRSADQRSMGGGGVKLLRQTEIAQFDESFLRYEQVVGLNILHFRVTCSRYAVHDFVAVQIRKTQQ